MMESRGLQSCLENLQDDGTLNNIATVTRDMDNKSWKILEEFGFDKQSERIRPRSLQKNFDHRWKSFTDQYKNFEYVENGNKNLIKQLFRGLLIQLKHWLNIILKIDNDDE